MAITQIDGDTQIRNETIGNAQIALDAAIALSKLEEAVIQADGGQNFTADQSMGGYKLTSVGSPVTGTDAVNKDYVDSIVTAGISWKPAVKYATAAALPANTYLAGVITADVVGILTVDGSATVLGDRILVKDEATGENNGIYDVTTEGTAGVAFILTRSTDANIDSEVTSGMAMFVQAGTANIDMGFVLTTDDPITLGTTVLTFTQFTSVGQVVAGAGLTKTLPGTLDVGTGDGIQVDADSITVKLDGVSLVKSGSGLKIDYSRWVNRETPSGSLPGTVFTTANAVLSGTEQVFLNGILQEPAGEDYTFSATNTITFVSTIGAGRRIKVNYIKA
jgi:hypothetical protein